MDIFDRNLYHILRFLINLNDDVINKNYPKEIAGMYLLQLGYSIEEIEDICVEVNVVLQSLDAEAPEHAIIIVANEATSNERLKYVVISWLFTILYCLLEKPNEKQLNFIKYMIASLDIEPALLETMVDEGDQRGYFLLRSSAAYFMEGFHNKFLERCNS